MRPLHPTTALMGSFAFYRALFLSLLLHCLVLLFFVWWQIPLRPSVQVGAVEADTLTVELIKMVDLNDAGGRSARTRQENDVALPPLIAADKEARPSPPSASLPMPAPQVLPSPSSEMQARLAPSVAAVPSVTSPPSASSPTRLMPSMPVSPSQSPPTSDNARVQMEAEKGRRAETTLAGYLSAQLKKYHIYPSQASLAGLEGEAIVRVSVDANGALVSITLDAGTLDPILEHAAQELISRVRRNWFPPPVKQAASINMKVDYILLTDQAQGGQTW